MSFQFCQVASCDIHLRHCDVELLRLLRGHGPHPDGGQGREDRLRDHVPPGHGVIPLVLRDDRDHASGPGAPLLAPDPGKLSCKLSQLS